MKITHLNQHILDFYATLPRMNGEIQIPKNLMAIARLLIVLLTFARLFTSDEIDVIIDEIIAAINDALEALQK
jgi:hypothetical protein